MLQITTSNFPRSYISVSTIPFSSMSLLQKWMSLPAKARYYIAGSTFIFALAGEYVTTRVNEEAVAQKKILEEIQDES